MRDPRARAALTLALAALAAPLLAELAWQTDFAAAARTAKESGTDLFVFVGGSDWCAPARAFKREVLKAPAVEAALGKAFVCVALDRPDRASPEQKAAAAQREKGFEAAVHNYPGVVLLDAEGRCYLKLEAPQGGAEALLAAVRQARALKARRDAALERAAKLSGAARAQALGAALEGLGEYALRDGRHSHRALFDELKRLDPQDAAGTQRRLTFNPDALAERDLWPLLNAKRYDEALARVDQELQDPRNNARVRQHLLGLRFHVFQAQDRLTEALQALKQLVQADPSSELAALARSYADYLTLPVTLAGPSWKPEHLRPHFADWRLDATALIRAPGRYEIAFRRTDGEDLSVRDVALLAGTRELARAAVPAGRDRRVELEVKTLPAGQRLWLAIAAKGHGWFSSRGEIEIRKL